MMYLTDSKGDGSPCIKVYEGKVMKWYYCKDEKELFSSLINLLKGDKGFRIFNVYGKRIYIPENPEDFIVKEILDNFEGIVYNSEVIIPLVKMSRELVWKRGVVRVKLKEKTSAEEVLKLGVRIVKPIKLPVI